jgi:hypothetical protein
MSALEAVLPYLIGAALIAVLVVLLTGVTGMIRGGDFNARYGNILMRWRVGTQALAVLLLLIYFLL